MSTAILNAKGIHKAYKMGRGEVSVLRGASLRVEEGEFVVIMGSSGSGKSTLLHMLGALDKPDRGQVEFRGQSVFDQSKPIRNHYRNQDVGFVFQFYHLLPELNVLENIAIPRLVYHSFFGWRAAKRKSFAEAREMLERVGLAEREKHRPSELSGGEMQRVAIARALLNRPALLLADEPTGNLDAKIGTEVLAMLQEFNDAGQTIVMVTHDGCVAEKAHRTVRLTDGVIQADSGTRSGSKSKSGSEAGDHRRGDSGDKPKTEVV